MKHIGFGVTHSLLRLDESLAQSLSYLVDNNPLKVGQKIGNLEIFMPSKLLEEENKDDVFIWVLTSRVYAEIAAQLKEMGFVEGKHFINALGVTRDDKIPALYGKGKPITLSAPKITQQGGRSRLSCELDVYDSGQTSEIWFEVDSRYEQYLLYERADAFVLSVLWHAMQLGRDIKCEAPVTEELMYNLETIFIPTIAEYGEIELYPSKIFAETCSEKLGGEGVGTGLSRGVDSFYTIKTLLESKYQSLKPTHLLTFYQHGMFSKESFGAEYNDMNRFDAYRAIADELGLPLIELDAFLPSGILATRRDVLLHQRLACIHAVKKCFKLYHYSTNHHITDVAIRNTTGGEYNEFLGCYFFGHSDMQIRAMDLEKTRYEKTVEIADWPLAQKYLRLNRPPKSHDITGKNARALIDLDIAGKLDSVCDVFDVEYYRKNRKLYFEALYKRYKAGNDYAANSVEALLLNIDKFIESIGK